MSRTIRPMSSGLIGCPASPELVPELRIVAFVSVVVIVVLQGGPGQDLSVLCKSLALLLPVLAAAIRILARGRIDEA